MKKYILGSIVVAGALLVGCGSDGGECCGTGNSLATKGVEAPKPMPPIANISRAVKADASGSQNEAKSGVDGEVYRIPTVKNIVNIYTISFDCKNSIDNDSFDANENNKSIERCDWNITKPDGCVGPSLETAESVELNCTDTPDLNETVFVKLTVTDDENQTAEANTTVIY